MASPTIGSLFAQRVVVGVGDMAVSNNSQMVLSTYALGSCVGVVAYDPVMKVGGLLHFLLPDSTLSPQKASAQPGMFADTGLPVFFNALYGLKAHPTRIRIFVCGGASVLSGQDPFKIGDRNVTAAMNYLNRQGLVVKQRDVGGTVNRTIHLEISSGSVELKTPVANSRCSLGG